MAPKKTNRHPVKQYFITFPQWTTTKDSDNQNCEALVAKMPASTYAICCQEAHEDQGFHYHMAIVLRFGIAKKKLLEWIQNLFPNDFKRVDCPAMYSLKASIEYCKKESWVFFEKGIPPRSLKINGEDMIIRYLRGIGMREQRLQSLISEAHALGITLDEFLRLEPLNGPL